jgi:hypothetical protein
MDGVLTQERVREHWDRQPCVSELSAREPASRDFYLDVERQRKLTTARLPARAEARS